MYQSSAALRALLLQGNSVRPCVAAVLDSCSRVIHHSTGGPTFDRQSSKPGYYRKQRKSTAPLNASVALPIAEERIEIITKTVVREAIIPKVGRTIPKTSDPHSNAHLPVLNVEKFRNLTSNSLSMYCYERKLKWTKVSYYLELISPISEEGTFSQVQRNINKKGRPLILMFPWLMAKPAHVKKYCRLYTDLGIDVLKVQLSPYDLLRPVPRAQVASKEVVQFLQDNPKWDKVVLHGMSVGAYGFMEVMNRIEEDERQYLPIRSRFVGQVWDSPCDLPGLKEGVARSVSDNRAVQETVMDILSWFLKVRYEQATRHYVKTQDMYHKNYCQSPAIFIYSRADRVSEAHINTDQANSWYKYGFEVFTKVFNESIHVGHYQKYKTEYTANVMAFLEHVGVLKHAGIHLEDDVRNKSR